MEKIITELFYENESFMITEQKGLNIDNHNITVYNVYVSNDRTNYKLLNTFGTLLDAQKYLYRQL